MRSLEYLNVASALLKTSETNLVRLTADGVGKYFDGGFCDHLFLAPSAQGRTHRSFQRAEETLDRPTSAKVCFFQIPVTHLSAPPATTFAVGSPLNCLNDAFHTPLLSALFVDPLRIVARIGVKPLRPSHLLSLGQQGTGLDTVMGRLESHLQGQRQQAPTEYDDRYLHPSPESPASAAAEVVTNGSAAQAGGVHGRRLFCGCLSANAGQDLLDDRQHLAARTEFLQRGIVRQLVGQTQPLTQRLAGCQHVQYSAIGGPQISPQNQATHQLPLREIMPAARRPVVSQIRPAQSHGQFSDLLNQRHFGLIHGLGLAHAYRRRIRTKKGFYKARSTFNFQFFKLACKNRGNHTQHASWCLDVGAW